MKRSPSYLWFVKLNFLVLGLILVVYAIRHINQNGLGPVEEIFGFNDKSEVEQPLDQAPIQPAKSIESQRKARLIKEQSSQNVDKGSVDP